MENTKTSTDRSDSEGQLEKHGYVAPITEQQKNDAIYLELVSRYEKKLEENPNYDEDCNDDDSDYDEDEICGYYCLCCGHTQEDNDECEICMSNALDEIYF